MRVLFITLLAIVALLCGGCSAFFLLASLFDARPAESLSYVGIPALFGLIFAAACFLVLRALSRRTPASPRDEAPGDKPKGHW